MYRVEFRPAALRQLARFPTAIRRRIVAKAETLGLAPRPPGAVKLSGETKTYRVRVGDYRIIYDILDEQVLVLVVKVGHRREVYR